MRPGLLHPGCTEAGIERYIYRRASMRPGLLHPGCFGRAQMSALRVPCFNEAGAFTPRMPFASMNSSLVISTASMRPGLLHPGCRGCQSSITA